MKRPWQIWTLYLSCLAAVSIAMAWLTVKALEADRSRADAMREAVEARMEETESRRQAELAWQQADLARGAAVEQELVSNALWRMDWALTPLIAQEATRPYSMYQPQLVPKPVKIGKTTPQLELWPLYEQPSDFVLLHFQVTPDNQWSSPQRPVGEYCDIAIGNGASQVNIQCSAERLDELERAINHENLLAMLPEKDLPEVEITERWWALNSMLNNDAPQAQNATDLGFLQLDEVQQQSQQEPLPQAGQQAARYNAPASQVRRMRRGEPELDQQLKVPPNVGDQYLYSIEQGYQRGNNEWRNRKQGFEATAFNMRQQTLVNPNWQFKQTKVVREGVSRPIWVGSNLLLARRVIVDDKEVRIQGCWLNWPKIKDMLLEQIDDLLPEAELVPVLADGDVEPGRMLVTLPVQVIIPAPTLQSTVFLFEVDEPKSESQSFGLSPIRLSLIVAWACMVLASGAIALLLHGVLRMSERRGAFVSAVTHELRTPLTTFRMYAEMLSAGMVREPAQQQKYLETLRVEGDRLSHLVENVLSYARLERGRPGKSREQVSVDALVAKVEPRLADRAAQAEMKLVVEADDTTRETTFRTDPSAVEQVLFNLVDNACKYASAAEDKRIHLRLVRNGDSLGVQVCDHGPGISKRGAKRLFRPFSKSVDEAAHTAPGVGLGLALSQRLARALGGRLQLESCQGKGACFVLSLPV